MPGEPSSRIRPKCPNLRSACAPHTIVMRRARHLCQQPCSERRASTCGCLTGWRSPHAGCTTWTTDADFPSTKVYHVPHMLCRLNSSSILMLVMSTPLKSREHCHFLSLGLYLAVYIATEHQLVTTIAGQAKNMSSALGGFCRHNLGTPYSRSSISADVGGAPAGRRGRRTGGRGRPGRAGSGAAAAPAPPPPSPRSCAAAESHTALRAGPGLMSQLNVSHR